MIFNNNKNIKSNTFFDEDKFKNNKIFNLLLDESSVKNIFVKL